MTAITPDIYIFTTIYIISNNTSTGYIFTGVHGINSLMDTSTVIYTCILSMCLEKIFSVQCTRLYNIKNCNSKYTASEVELCSLVANDTYQSSIKGKHKKKDPLHRSYEEIRLDQHLHIEHINDTDTENI